MLDPPRNPVDYVEKALGLIDDTALVGVVIACGESPSIEGTPPQLSTPGTPGSSMPSLPVVGPESPELPPVQPPVGAPAPHSAPPVPDDPGPVEPPPPPPGPQTRQGTVKGCNTYGQNCEGNPIYVNVPGPGYNWRAEPTIARVPNGSTLTARCWATGGTTYNYAASHQPPHYGPNPYESNVYFSVQAPDGRWGFIPDTYFVRDKGGRLGMPAC